MTGIIEGFEIFNSGIFFFVVGGGGGVGKFGKYLFGWVDLSKDFFGYSKQSEVSW